MKWSELNLEILAEFERWEKVFSKTRTSIERWRRWCNFQWCSKELTAPMQLTIATVSLRKKDNSKMAAFAHHFPSLQQNMWCATGDPASITTRITCSDHLTRTMAHGSPGLSQWLAFCKTENHLCRRIKQIYSPRTREAKVNESIWSPQSILREFAKTQRPPSGPLL